MSEFHLGARTVAAFDGSIDDCDTLSGPVNVSSVDARIVGCAGYDAADSDNWRLCTPAEAAALDAVDSGQTVEEASFDMIRVEQPITCETVCGLSY